MKRLKILPIFFFLLLFFSTTLLAATYTVTNCSSSESDVGSLPWAINCATQEGDIIEFNIPDALSAGGEDQAGKVTDGTNTWYRIVLDSSLQVKANSVQIRGSTQPNTNLAGPDIEIRTFSGFPVIKIDGKNNVTVEGIAFGKLGEDGGTGITVSNADNAHIYGCYFGLSATGEVAAPNKFGINVHLYYSNGSVIGGDDPTYRNVVSNTRVIGTENGVRLNFSNNCKIYNNYVGTTSTGEGAFPCGFGIYLENSSNNVIGDKNKGNVISGNKYGVFIYTNSANNIVSSNIIGLNASMNRKVANEYGIYLQSAGTGNVIGPVATMEAGEFLNVISGNQIGIYAVNISGLKIRQNVIGSNFPTFSTGLGNSEQGIYLSNCQNCEIGGVGSFETSVIVGNGADGILLMGSSNNLISGNYVGVVPPAGGSSVGMKNGYDGIRLEAVSNDNIIGLPVPGGANHICSNEGNGINITNSSNNKIYHNFIGIFRGDGVDKNYRNTKNGIRIAGVSTNNIIGTSDSLANFISYNLHNGISLESNVTSCEIIGNYIGVKTNGNEKAGNLLNGIYCYGSNNVIAKNVIGGNSNNGILFNSALNNKVLGNYVGISPTNADIGNSQHGVYLTSNSILNQIGGENLADRNYISNNSSDGINLYQSPSNKILGNYIGVSVEGNQAAPNSYSGIAVTQSGNTFVSNNVISGNSLHGISINNSHSNEIYSNLIGVDYSGNTTVPNKGDGIRLRSSSFNKIGAELKGNVIGGNNKGFGGIYVFVDSTKTTGSNEISDNFIGISQSGVPIGNTRGIYLVGDSGATILDTVIASNTIAYNTYQGILCSQPSSSLVHRNKFSKNSIFSNGTLGISLGSANNGIQKVTIVTANVDRFNKTLQVSGEGARANALVEVFLADGSANAQGKTYLGEIQADTDGRFSGLINLTFIPTPEDGIVATQTDVNNNTSMFSDKKVVSYIPWVYQPDLLVGRSQSDYTGEGVYESVPVVQVKSRVVTTNVSAEYWVKLINASQTSEAFVVKGTKGNSQFDVRYYTDEGNEITDELTREGGTMTQTAEVGVVGQLKVVVSSKGGSVGSYDVLITVESVSDPSKVDVIKCSTTFVRGNYLEKLNINTTSESIEGENIVLTIEAIDNEGNLFSGISSDSQIRVDEGLVTPESISASSFVGGVATVEVSIGKVGRRVISVTNGGVTGEAVVLVKNAKKEYTFSGIPGLSIVIPSGATTQDVVITASKVSDPSSGKLPSGYKVAGEYIDLGPDGLVFDVPVEVTMAIEGGPLKDPQVYYWDGSKWSKDGIEVVSVTSTSITFRTSHFTIFAPMSALSSNLVRFGPNPYNPINGIGRYWYWLDNDGEVSIYLIDVTGRLVWKGVYASGSNGGRAGMNSVEYDGKDGWGSVLGDGVYIYRVVQSGKVIGGGKIAVKK